jgi:hypothetical protein
MSIIFSLLIKRWREILILLLFGIILFLRGCGTDYGDKALVEVDGEQYELLESKTDTIYVEKEVKVTKYVPKYITKEVIKEVEIPIDVDSLAIIKDYFSKITVKDTLNLTYDFPEVITDSLGNKPSGDLGFGILTDIISQNSIESREIDWFFKIPTVYNTTIVKELPKNEFYWGINGGFNKADIISNVGGGLILKSKKNNLYQLGLGIQNNSNTSQLAPFVSAGMYWKIGKK